MRNKNKPQKIEIIRGASKEAPLNPSMSLKKLKKFMRILPASQKIKKVKGKRIKFTSE